MMRKHFVTFFSPGTFVSETTEKPIDSWDVDQAIEMARTIKERHGAIPYGFRFSTRSREDDELDSKVTATSSMYYLGGRLEGIDEIRARQDPRDDILLSNMRANDWDVVIVNENSWRITQPFHPGDVLLDVDMKPQGEVAA